MHVFSLFYIFSYEVQKTNHANVYDDSMDELEQFYNIMGTHRPVKKNRPLSKTKNTDLIQAL